jgi:DNA-directed RNA polymerase III subunit RPC3
VLSQKVTETLLRRGRLSLPQLVRYSALKPRTLRACILVLIQQNILWHASEDATEVFEVNVDECLMRLRFGRYIWQAEELFGQEVRRRNFFLSFRVSNAKWSGGEHYYDRAGEWQA